MSDALRGPTLFAGIGIGMLLGLLLGLSASPVVSLVVGGLVTAAAAYWNLSAGSTDAAASRTHGVRALAAGLLCVGCIAGLLGGLWLRARDVFGVSPAQQVERWKDAGYPPADARALAAFQTTGLTSRGYVATPGEKRNAATSTALFSGASESCDEVRPDDYADAANLRAAFVKAGGPWRAMADAVKTTDASLQMTLLRTAWQLACDR